MHALLIMLIKLILINLLQHCRPCHEWLYNFDFFKSNSRSYILKQKKIKKSRAFTPSHTSEMLQLHAEKLITFQQ